MSGTESTTETPPASQIRFFLASERGTQRLLQLAVLANVFGVFLFLFLGRVRGVWLVVIEGLCREGAGISDESDFLFRIILNKKSVSYSWSYSSPRSQ